MPPARSVLITGGASGIGLATARAFAAQGCPLLLADISPSVHEVARSLGTPQAAAHAFEADMGEETQVLALASEAMRLFGGCDVLVNCAGVSQKRDGKAIPPTEVRTADWERVLRINLTAPFLLCRELIPAMQRRKFGRIVNVASRAGRTFSKGAGSDYAASKAGLIGLTRHLAGTYAADGITVNAVAPGRVHTPLANTSSAEVLAKAMQEIPAGRFGTPDEIAQAIVFLASDGAAYLTGACLDVNGGGFMA
ncbi:SDR family NAD(P)-dependent oxidoreductase [Hydrogenophaga sp.]|uniref:SDR family NAD(P)-dependent oxidoreductase n=1 Tax=Hydrogenophaga sp. TaxID=1904254 RepID=UPI002616735B|nr:SDR family NAD(P)-dependent oxidoreductase [Hydrogenophaga sp.]MCW5652746.1 SDR family oxidoreductase [Hydrogenophaga sp.]